ncbi:S8 family serine peptidase [Actinospica sp.]|jgi:subtilisin family serine protease|uniref:S8 family serine peptidase n=1 Tax=Actinospica sp. TaxID=1872142 RepID=UPI002C6DEFBD|nr:S8 family serine peptidase [Actinospica sp.]HWG26075.1 S8 family serine peptidase [Actinospica sp.]
MSAFRKTRYAAAATVLACGTGLGLPAAAAAAATGLAASQASSNCTSANVTVDKNQADTPWEIQAANPGHLTNLQGNQLDGTGVKVAVIDTGIQSQGQLNAGGGTVLNGESTGPDADDDGHGTMVASIIGAQKAAGVNGMQGIAPGVQLLSLREAGCNAAQGSGNTEDAMAQAITDAVGEGATVINISQDGYDQDPKLLAAVQYAYSQGVVIVTSAGNQGDRDTTDNNGTDYGVNPRTYPASYPDVLAVGAVDQYGTVATFSESGTAKNTYFVGVVAPGVGVGGLLQNGKIAVDDGTSFASPYVAAEAALIIQEHHWTSSGDRTPARAYEVIKTIEATADGDGAYSPSLGWGEADIQNALNATVSDSLAASSGPISGLTPMLGIGPNADGQAAATSQQVDKTVVKPYVATAGNHEAENQQRWAYIALAAGLLTAIVALAAAAVARDAARRRGATQL